MSHRFFVLDVPENQPVAAVARSLPGVKVVKLGPYFAIESDAEISIMRRVCGARHAVWYSCVAGLEGGYIAQWDKVALTVVPR